MHGLYIAGVILYWLIMTLAVVHVVMDNRQPAKTMAWVLVILFVPVVGFVLYLFFGVNTRRERMVSQRSLDQLSKRSMLGFVEQQNLQLPERHLPLIDLYINQNFSLPFKDNDLQLLCDGEEFFPSLFQAIGAARDHIHIDLYIIEDDPLGMLVSDMLIDKARQGVEVRLIYDDVGCWNVRHRFFERMREEGIEVVPFLPVRFPSFTSKVNYRNHRKLIIIDGRVGFIGGMNIALRYYNKGTSPWRDLMVRVEGTGVYALQRAFLIDWYFVDRTLISSRKYYPNVNVNENVNDNVNARRSTLIQIVTSGPVSPYPEIMQGYVHAISSAKHTIMMETPYFLPTEPVLFALKMAALRGVDVRLIVPLRSDARFVEWASRSYLREVAEAGVRVWLYADGFLHSKFMVVDDSLCTCGSTNIDFRSFENNFESNIIIYDAAMASRFRDVFLSDQHHACQLSDVPERLHPPFLKRLLESLTRLLAPLF
jgi:cardiolipin synthase